ncbi:MAG: hypothetical protein WCS20_11850 [Alphaproteobacteria bacterium]|jgi:hypothetical protein
MITAVVVYSNTGNTRLVADAIADRLGVVVTVLVADQVQPTPWAILRLGFAVLFGGTTPVRIVGPDPAGADLVVLAAPVWAGRLAVPMRSWLATKPALPKRVALVMTGGAPAPSSRAMPDFADHAGCKPVATLYASEAQMASGGYATACDTFCRQIMAL